MKDIFAVLMAYPLWVKVTLVVLQATCGLLLVAFKPSSPQETLRPEQTGISVSVGTNMGGIVVGHGVGFQTQLSGPRTEELIRILELRATRIVEELPPHFDYAPVRKYIVRFRIFHAAHVDALKRGNLIEAHEILRQIHDLSRELESDEFWTRHHRETPDILYSLADGAFQRGRLIEWYVGSAPMEELVNVTLASFAAKQRRTPSRVAPADLYALVTKADAASCVQESIPSAGDNS
ncbi:MAG: hypothetical protein ACJ8LG_16295 [Massilia sp.]